MIESNKCCGKDMENVMECIAKNHFGCFLDIYSRFTSKSQVVRQAIKYDNENVLKYLYKHDENFSNHCEWALLHAAKYGRLKYIIYFREIVKCKWDVFIPAFAAKKGHLHILKYVREHGCPWNEDTINDAASGNSLECLKYAHENGCPWDDSCMYNAVEFLISSV